MLVLCCYMKLIDDELLQEIWVLRINDTYFCCNDACLKFSLSPVSDNCGFDLGFLGFLNKSSFCRICLILYSEQKTDSVLTFDEDHMIETQLESSFN